MIDAIYSVGQELYALETAKINMNSYISLITAKTVLKLKGCIGAYSQKNGTVWLFTEEDDATHARAKLWHSGIGVAPDTYKCKVSNEGYPEIVGIL